MGIDSDDANRILQEAILGQPLSIDSDEARAFRAKIDREIAEANEGDNDVVFDIPSEIPG